MDASARLAKLRNSILKEIVASARRWEIDEARRDEPGTHQIREMIDDLGGINCIGAGWHIEGYDSARHYLLAWAPVAASALNDLSDEVLDAAWKQAGMWDAWLEAATDGAHRGLHSVLEAAQIREQIEAEED